MSHCHFCDADFVSGSPCRTQEQRDKCSEWAAAKMVECDYWNGRKSLSDRPPQYLQGRREALKWAVTWLYARSESMNDPHAKIILNAAAYNMGEDVKDGKFPKVKHPSSVSRPNRGGPDAA